MMCKIYIVHSYNSGSIRKNIHLFLPFSCHEWSRTPLWEYNMSNVRASPSPTYGKIGCLTQFYRDHKFLCELYPRWSFRRPYCSRGDEEEPLHELMASDFLEKARETPKSNHDLQSNDLPFATQPVKQHNTETNNQISEDSTYWALAIGVDKLASNRKPNALIIIILNQ